MYCNKRPPGLEGWDEWVKVIRVLGDGDVDGDGDGDGVRGMGWVGNPLITHL